MKKIILSLFATFFCSFLTAQTLYFPPIIGNTWATTSPASLGWCQPPIDDLLNYLGERNTKAFIVLKDGKIVIEKYYDNFTQDSLWYWASAGKTLTSFMVGIAQQEGYLSIQDTSSKYLGAGWTSCSAAKEDLITIRHQLTMTSGLDDGVTDPYCTLPSCMQYKADAGTRWAYHNAPYTMLDGVIEGATGQTLNSYLTQKVKTVTGMTGSFYPSGYNNVYVSNARSMARFGLLILNKGNWNGTQIMTDTSYFSDMVNTSQNLNLSYGYLWWLNGKSSFMVPGAQWVIPSELNPSAPSDMIAALGKNGQFIDVVPSQKLVFIRMGNAPIAGDVPFTLNDTIWQKLNLVMCATSTETPQLPTNTFTIYPNPTQHTFTLNNSQQQHIQQVSLYNLQGKKVWQQSPENTMLSQTFTIPSLSAQLYWLEIQTTNHIERKKLWIGE